MLLRNCSIVAFCLWFGPVVLLLLGVFYIYILFNKKVMIASRLSFLLPIRL